MIKMITLVRLLDVCCFFCSLIEVGVIGSWHMAAPEISISCLSGGIGAGALLVRSNPNNLQEPFVGGASALKLLFLSIDGSWSSLRDALVCSWLWGKLYKKLDGAGVKTDGSMGLDRLHFGCGCWAGVEIWEVGKKGSISHGETLSGLWTVVGSSHWT